jgi:ribosome-interacting GTPase 1
MDTALNLGDKSMGEKEAESLIKAVQQHHHKEAHRLLEEAGGACQARDLAQLAKDSQSWFSRRSGTVEYDVKKNGDNETLTLSDDFWGKSVITSLTQKKCEK